MTEARSVVVRLTAETAQYIAQMQAAGKLTAGAMTTAEAATMRQSQAVDTLGGKAGKLGLVAGVALGGMAKAAMDWESEWAGVAKTVNGTSEQLDGLEDDLRELARTMPATHEEIAATAEAAGQLGVATDDITDFTKVMVEMGSATNLTADEAATSIAQFMNVMQTAAGDVDEIGNTIVDLGNKGASTESQITNMAQRVAGAGQLIGASEADVLGLSSAMANLGINAELGGSAVQRSLIIINTAVKDGGDSLEGFAELAGMTAEQFATKWSTDPVRAFDAVVQGLSKVQDSGGNVVSTLADLGIKGTQNLQVLLRLAGSGDMLSTSLDQANAAWETNTALSVEYGKRAETTASQVTVAWNQIKDAAIEGGAAVLPVIADIASVVGTAADAFGSLPDPIHEVVTAMLAITAITGGGLWLGAKTVRGVLETRAAVATLTPEISRMGSTLLTRSGVRQFTADLAIMASTSRTAGATTTRELERTAAASARVRSNLSTIGVRGGALLAGLTLASTDLADGMGLSNTASYALMGTIAGPWGTAIGGGIGLIKDFHDASKSAGAVIDDFNHSLDGTDTAKMLSGFQALQSKTQDLNADLDDTHFILSKGIGDALGDTWSGIVDAFGAGATDLNEASDESVDKLTNLTGVLRGVALANGDFIASASNDKMQNLGYGNLEDLARVAAKVQPLLDDLGYSLQDLMELDPGSSEAVAAVQAINDALAAADSNKGRAEAVGQALEGLGNDMDTTADKADALSDSLDALLDPQLDLAAATDEWTTALRHLSDDLAKDKDGVALHTQTLKGNSDAAITNRAAIRDRVGQLKDMLVTEADAGAGSGKLSKTYKAQRQALLDAADAAGINRDEMKALIKEYGLTPGLVKTVIQADADQAKQTIMSVGDWLDHLDGKTATTWIKTIQTGYDTKRHNMGVANQAAGGPAGGSVRGPGTSTSDSIPAMLSDGEFVMKAAAVDHYGLSTMHAMNAMHLAGGGAANGTAPRSLDSRLAIAQLIQEIHGYEHDLKATGKKNHLEGNARRIAALQLETAERDLHRAKTAEAREAAQEARDKAKERRDKPRDRSGDLATTADALSFDSLLPHDDPTVAQGVSATIADFKRDVLAAGGTWTKAMHEWAQGARSAAHQYDATTAAIETEQQNRDELSQTLDEEKTQLETLNSTMSAYADTVASKFLNDPFNGAHTETVDGVAGPASAAQAQAQEQLAAIQAQGGGLQAGAEASRLIQLIQSLQEQVDAETAAHDVQISGLAAFRTTLDTDTENAEAMTKALQVLEDKGLDTDGAYGGLYEQLAASGDFATASELAALSAEQIDEYEKLFKAREDAAATLAAKATQAVYGEQNQKLIDAIADQTAAIAASDATLTVLNATQVVLAEQLRARDDVVSDLIAPQLRDIQIAIEAIPRGLVKNGRK